MAALLLGNPVLAPLRPEEMGLLKVVLVLYLLCTGEPRASLQDLAHYGVVVTCSVSVKLHLP